MATFYVEIWDGQQWQRLPTPFPTSSAADRWQRARSLCSPRVVRVEQPCSALEPEAA